MSTSKDEFEQSGLYKKTLFNYSLSEFHLYSIISVYHVYKTINQL